MSEYLIQDTTLEAIGDAIRAKEESSALIPVADFADRINALGAGLNFEVVGGTSQPTNPKENTIWVNTSTAITSWIFSAVEPTEPAEGMVWISIGTSSAIEFNALKKNAIQVYPISAKQYIDGACVKKTAESYQNGEWVGWIFYAFKDGEIRLGEMYTSTPERLYISNGELIFKNSNGNGSWGYFTKTLDLTSYRKMKVKIKQTSVFDNMYCAFVSVTQKTPTAASLASIKARSDAYLELTVKDGVYHELETSVKGLSGEYYVEVAAIAYGAISEIWFE